MPIKVSKVIMEIQVVLTSLWSLNKVRTRVNQNLTISYNILFSLKLGCLNQSSIIIKSQELTWMSKIKFNIQE